MELWQMDMVGRIHLADGTELSTVTEIDDHSSPSTDSTASIAEITACQRLGGLAAVDGNRRSRRSISAGSNRRRRPHLI